MKYFVFCVTTFILLILFVAGHVPQIAKNRDENSQMQAPRTATTQELFGRALSAAHSPGGFVWMMNCSGEEPRFTDDGAIPPLHEALESIAKLDPRYKSQTDNGVVNLLPTKGEPPLLKVRIKRFKVNTDLNRALEQLLALEEVRDRSADLGLKQNTMTLLVGGTPIKSKSASIEIDLQNVSLREALNALVKAHGRAIWQYREYHCNGAKEFSVTFF
jgi:hypothetical protein